MSITVWLLYVLFLCFLNFSHQQNINFNYKNLAIPKVYDKKVRDYIFRNGTNEKLTKCHSHLLYYLDILGSLNGINNWAKQMYDSGTKVPSGILNGNTVDYGVFDQCMAIKTKISQEWVYGKYCLASISLNPLILNEETKEPIRATNALWDFGLKFALCVPDSCSTEEIEILYNNLNLSVQKIELSEEFCQSKPKQPKINAADIAVMIFLCTIVVIMALSTIYDICYFYAEKKPAHLLIAFSILTNGKKLLKTTKSSDRISCLHGIRAISMMWIILAHRYYQSKGHPYQNIPDIFKWSTEQGSMYIIGATLAVDTFLMLSGLLIGYGFMSKTKFSSRKYYLHRYIRLTPSIIVVMILYMTLFRHLGSGPWWNYNAQHFRKPCEESWWTVFLYVQNYATVNHCIEQSWYLSVDTQLYFLSPLILLPLKKRPLLGYLLISLLVFLTILAGFLTSWIFNLYGLITKNYGIYYYKYYYIATHTRAAPWLIGVALGYHIYNNRENKPTITINRVLVLSLWIISLSLLVSCIFAGHMTVDQEYDRLGNAFYVALLTPGWAIGLGLLIFLCLTGYGGPINWFLSAPIFQILSKFTYSMFLTHMGIQALIFAQDRVVPYMRNINMLYSFWGDYMWTLAISLLFTLAFECPIQSIEKFILDKNNRDVKEKKSDNKIEIIE